MPLLTLILTCPFVLIAKRKAAKKEYCLFLKLLGIWLLCQAYITLNDNFRVYIGIICATLIVFNDKINRLSKLTALIIGLISLISSSLVFLITRN